MRTTARGITFLEVVLAVALLGLVTLSVVLATNYISTASIRNSHRLNASEIAKIINDAGDGDASFEVVPDRRTDFVDAVIAAALQIHDDGLAVDGLVDHVGDVDAEVAHEVLQPATRG